MSKQFELFFWISVFFSQPLIAQQTYTLEVDEILTIPQKNNYDQEIVSASKKAESLFEAPLAASVLTAEEIKASGATNIMEAIRLIPGVIVRQMTNGVYNIHLRGMDWMPYIAEEDVLSGVSRLALIMIDGRPVYNYVLGSTYWETLPIALNDVERIEVIRGPAASLYGPNAVTGVINIITQKIQRDGLYAVANAQVGSYNTHIANASVGYRANNQWSFMVSANREYRERTHNLYYNKEEKDYTEAADIRYFGGTLTGPDAEAFLFPDSEVSLRKESVNAYVDFTPNEHYAFSIKLGHEDSYSNKVLFPNFDTFLTKFKSRTSYADLNARVFNATLKASYRSGEQNPVIGVLYEQNIAFGDIDFSYELVPFKGLSITPSVGYRSASYRHPIDQSLVLDSPEKALNAVLANIDPTLPAENAIPSALGQAFAPPFGIIPGTSNIDNLAFALRLDYKTLRENLRFIGSVRADRFINLKDRYYLSYQFSSTYILNEKHFFRAGISRSNASQFLLDTQITLSEPFLYNSPFGPLPAFRLTRGNPNIDLINQTTIELGYRAKLNDNLSVNVELFRGELNNMHSNTKDSLSITLDAPIPYATQYQNFQDLPHRAIQTGATISLNFTNKNLWIKPYLTLQQTRIKNYNFVYATEEFQTNYPELVPALLEDFEPQDEIEHEATPGFFGGIFINYKLLGKLNLNANSYFMGNQLMRRNLGEGSNFYETGARIITNFRIGYDLNRQSTLFASVRDLSNTSTAEYFYTDPIRTMYFFGLNYVLK